MNNKTIQDIQEHIQKAEIHLNKAKQLTKQLEFKNTNLKQEALIRTTIIDIGIYDPNALNDKTLNQLIQAVKKYAAEIEESHEQIEDMNDIKEKEIHYMLNLITP